MHIIVVGAGGTCRELLRGLGDHWDITVIDPDADRLARAAKVRQIDQVLGDGSSRVVLERAALARAHALIATTSDDEVNLEACRLATEAGVMRLASVARDPERLPEYRALNVPAFSRARLTARRLEIQVEPRRVTSAAFAEGLAEALEFHITSDSPMLGRALRDLHSERFLVAALLRDGRLIVPHGDTVLGEGDLVTVVGAAADYSAIVEVFTAGESRFPLDYGNKVAVAVVSEADLNGPFAEAVALVRSTVAESVLVVHRDPAEITEPSESARAKQLIASATDQGEGVEVRFRAVDDPEALLARIAREEGAGVIVVPRPGGGRVLRRTRTSRLIRSASDVGLPLLLSAGTHPYGRVVVPARDTPAGRTAGRAGIGLVVQAGTELEGVAVLPPAFVAGAEARDEALRAIAALREDGAAHGLTIRRRIRKGNPVRVIEDLAADAGLLVLGVEHPPTWLMPGLLGYLASRSPVSTLVVPVRD